MFSFYLSVVFFISKVKLDPVVSFPQIHLAASLKVAIEIKKFPLNSKLSFGLHTFEFAQIKQFHSNLKNSRLHTVLVCGNF